LCEGNAKERSDTIPGEKMRIALTILAFIFICATVLPFIRQDDWWIRIFDFPRTQIAIGGLIVLLVSLIFYVRPNTAELIIFAVLAASVAYQFYRMSPYTPITSIQVLNSERNNSDDRLSVLISNVYMKNREAEKLLRQIDEYDPDVICLLEPDDWWESQVKPLEGKYPHTSRHVSDDTYGMIFFTRLKPLTSDVNYLVEEYIPSVHSILELRSGEPVEFYCVHPNPPNPKYADDTTERDAELLIVGKKAKDSGKPTIVAGDLNDVAWSHTTSLFQKISGLLDPRIGRGFYNTFHAKYPVIRFPLDHVFVSESFRLVRLERLPYVGSDHFPMYVELSYEPQNREDNKKNKPDADTEEKKEAKEKIEDAE
jgi:endonuclease/exonuclease/phosphatase (EEP) superfamily protein YafD